MKFRSWRILRTKCDFYNFSNQWWTKYCIYIQNDWNMILILLYCKHMLSILFEFDTWNILCTHLILALDFSRSSYLLLGRWSHVSFSRLAFESQGSPKLGWFCPFPNSLIIHLLKIHCMCLPQQSSAAQNTPCSALWATDY